MLRRHFFLVAALVVLAVMAVAGGIKAVALKTQDKAGASASGGAQQGAAGGRRGGALPVRVEAIAPRTFQDTIEVLGVAKGRRSVTLTAAAAQLVDKVRFSDGQHVPQGAVLIELRNSEQGAGVAQAQARLVEAQRAYERYRTLGEKGFASKAAIDQHEAAYRSAQADLAAARARENDRIIRAPFAGVVGLSDVAPGALVNPGSPIVTLDDITAVRVDFQVPEQFLAQLHEGQALLATADAFPGETIRGAILKVDTRVDERTRAITARAEFPNPKGRLKPGMMLRVGISRGVRQGLSAPETAVAVQGDTASVFVVRQAGERTIAEQRAITTGARQEGAVEILAGVQAGEQVVAEGLNRVLPGQPVRVIGKPAARDGGARADAARPAA